MMRNTDLLPALTGDRAKCALEEDEFGLRLFAETLATAVQSRITADGYTIGVEGEWGSGKTTLLNFLQCAIKAAEPKYHRLIRFEPWLIGKREQLLTEFFKQLSVAIKDITCIDAVRSKLEQKPGLADRLVARINTYGKLISVGVTGAEKVAAYDPTGCGPVAALILRVLYALAKALQKSAPSLEQAKEAVVADLRRLENLLPEFRITVLIDDTDRLDPEEGVEILRLIKGVANFPLVTYVVAFDRKQLGLQIKTALHVDDGEAYLEKFFQQLLPMPPQEPFALRRFIRAKLTQQFPGDLVVPEPSDLDRIGQQDALFDKWLGLLIKTPRDAHRLLDAVKFGWPHLRGTCDFVDYVWLQLLKLKCPEFYQWAESYMAGVGSYRDGGRPGDEEPAVEAARLREILVKLGWSSVPDRSGITYFLPGVRNYVLDGAKSRVFEFTPSDELARFEKNGRLGSPSHWRLYFAFDMPSYALDDAELDAIVETGAKDWRAVAQALRGLLKRDHQHVGHYLDIALDRLIDRAERLSPDQQIGLARAFAEMMDDVPRGTLAQFVGDDPWRRTLKLLGRPVAAEWNDIVASGRSINWLSVAMLDQGRALGVVDPNRQAPDRQWLTRDEFDSALKLLIDRFRTLGIEAICDEPEPLQILYCWLRLGDGDEVRGLVSTASETDEGFIRTLTAMRSYMNSSATGFNVVLLPTTVDFFMDAKLAQERLVKIVQDSTSGSELQVAAAKLLGGWSDH